MLDTQTVIWTILVGAVSGFTVAFIGYFKGTTIEKFKLEKFVPTILIGGFIGALMAALNMPYDQAYQFGVSIGAVYAIENISKIIVRRIKDWWNKLPPTHILKRLVQWIKDWRNTQKKKKGKVL